MDQPIDECGSCRTGQTPRTDPPSLYPSTDGSGTRPPSPRDEESWLGAAARLRPDLAAVDLSLPGPRLSNIARRIQSCCADLRFLIMSVHDEPAAIDECLAAGAMGLVLKRSAATDLIPAIERALAGSAYVSPCMSSHAR